MIRAFLALPSMILRKPRASGDDPTRVRARFSLEL